SPHGLALSGAVHGHRPHAWPDRTGRPRRFRASFRYARRRGRLYRRCATAFRAAFLTGRMNVATPATAAFYIGGSKIEFARVSSDGTVTNRATLPTPHTSWDDFVSTLRRLIEADGGAARIGISIAGTTDSATGVALAANVPVVTGHRIESEIAEALGIPVRVGNDADCFALAEAMIGAGKGLPIVFGAILGTGVGGGLVIGGRMVRGANGVTGEW